MFVCCSHRFVICDLWWPIYRTRFSATAWHKFLAHRRQNHKCSPISAHKLVPPWVTPFLWTLRLLLVKMTTTPGDSPMVERHLRYRHEFLKSLSNSKEKRCLHLRKIPCASLLTLVRSPWRYLLALHVNQALITMTSFDGVSFASLLQKFALLFNDYTPFNTSHITLKQDPLKGGHPRKVCPEDCLGLMLIWTHTRGS